jgi:hypothetical protein
MPTEVFKILGGTDPATSSLGLMTQGLGFPLRPVEPAVSAGAVQVQQVTRLDARSYLDQEPIALDTLLNLTLGDAQTTDNFDVDAAGLVTCLVAGSYNVRFRLLFGRTGNNLTSTIFGRILFNGLQISDPVHTLLGNASAEIPTTFEAVFPMAIDDTLRLQIYRDSSGVDDGGVFSATASLGGWGVSPSVIVYVTESLAISV